MVESVTETGVSLALIPSPEDGPTELWETVRPKTELPAVLTALLSIVMPVEAFRILVLTKAPLASPVRINPLHAPATGSLPGEQVGSSDDGQAMTPAALSARLVKIFWLLDPVLSALSVASFGVAAAVSLMKPLPTLTMSPAASFSCPSTRSESSST